MKKISIVFIVIMIVMTFTACRKDSDKEKTDNLKQENLTEIIEYDDEEQEEQEGIGKPESNEQSESKGQPNSSGQQEPVKQQEGTEKQENPTKPEDADDESDKDSDSTTKDEKDEDETFIELPIIPY